MTRDPPNSQSTVYTEVLPATHGQLNTTSWSCSATCTRCKMLRCHSGLVSVKKKEESWFVISRFVHIGVGYISPRSMLLDQVVFFIHILYIHNCFFENLCAKMTGKKSTCFCFFYFEQHKCFKHCICDIVHLKLNYFKAVYLNIKYRWCMKMHHQHWLCR